MSTPDDKQVGLFVGWGARHAQAQLVELAELLNAPVATTLQGLAVFPADHPCTPASASAARRCRRRATPSMAATRC